MNERTLYLRRKRREFDKRKSMYKPDHILEFDEAIQYLKFKFSPMDPLGFLNSIHNFGNNIAGANNIGHRKKI